jgi:hypothetical protein
MVRFAGARTAVAAYLIINLSAAFLPLPATATASVHPFENKKAGVAFFAPAETPDPAAATPQIIQNCLGDAPSSLAPEPPRFFIPCGTWDGAGAFSRASAAGSNRTPIIDKKNLIPLKLRI